MANPIADSIDAVLEVVNTTEDGPNFDTFYDSAKKSAELQRLIVAHVSKFYSSDSVIPERISLMVLHTFWLGFEAGRAAAVSENMESIFL